MARGSQAQFWKEEEMADCQAEAGEVEGEEN